MQILDFSTVSRRRFEGINGLLHFPIICRLEVVPHFSSGIVERAKRERA